MALTLEQYASYLDTRDLSWPAAPEVERPRAKPHLSRLSGIRVVLWNVYGTLLNIGGGELVFEHPQKLLMEVALDKTVQEFKMWGSMSRKPGQPAEYLGQLYAQVLLEQRGIGSGTGTEKYPEVTAERIWEAKERLAQVLYDLALQYAQLGAGSSMIRIPISQSDLGDLAGVAVSTTERVLKDLRKQGILSTRYREITIRDLDYLDSIRFPQDESD